MSTESVMLSKQLILCCLVLVCFQSFPASGFFQWVNSSHQVAKVLEFSFSNSPSNEYSGLNSFRIDWFDLLSVQGTLRSLLQHHNLKASILQHSAFFMVQVSHLYMTTGKPIALTIWTLVSKVMSLIFNIFCLGLSELSFQGASVFYSHGYSYRPQRFWSPRKKKIITASTLPPSICHEVMGLNAIILLFGCWVLRQLFGPSPSPSSRGSLVPLPFLPFKWYHLYFWVCWYFSRESWFKLWFIQPSMSHVHSA